MSYCYLFPLSILRKPYKPEKKINRIYHVHSSRFCSTSIRVNNVSARLNTYLMLKSKRAPPFSLRRDVARSRVIVFLSQRLPPDIFVCRYCVALERRRTNSFVVPWSLGKMNGEILNQRNNDSDVVHLRNVKYHSERSVRIFFLYYGKKIRKNMVVRWYDCIRRRMVNRLFKDC